MKVLVLNSGSSSLKYQVVDMLKEEAIAEGICERIGLEKSQMKYKANGKKEEILHDMPTHKEAIDLVLKTLQGENGVIKSIEEIDAIGHRVVHGGEKFDKSVIVTKEILKEIQNLSSLAPLHNPANALGIEVCMELMPDKKNVAVFDTAFHQTMTREAYMYALPYEDYEDLKVRKYGFHGTSHYFVSQEAAKVLNNPEAKVIVCHLGNGASISAVKAGKCIETSMGLTPLQGLMMGTRCGDIDPAAVLYVMEKRGLTAKEMDTRMNKKSGILGVFGSSSDFRDLSKAIEEGNERAKTAYEMFVHRIKSYIGSYAAALNGVDAICFTAGIGENASKVREDVCKGLTYLGIDFNSEENSTRKDGIQELTKEGSKVKVFKIPTNEELVIAKDTYSLVK
ncbi:acetate kinase [Hypnocyclicus thermotrophus]|uniref:Acetate kinase n=1 Tax=Hypnocyclicus thermotrophus TaxID=1627895 RepID=A0AA46I5H2_9FUSO|nr:acetate kinase [Hypnocyclicus thermotrophus]TDT70491.1 acetate kinase [Hypnocyclicus thermotrophus]